MEEDTFSLVTIPELRELLKASQYKPTEEETEHAELLCDHESGLFYTDFFAHFGESLVISHLLAELCFENPEKIDFKRVTDGYDVRIISRLASLYLYPLTWIPIPPELSDNFVISGRVAQEKLIVDRYDVNLSYLISSEVPEKRIVNFATELPVFSINENSVFKREMHNWAIFLADLDLMDESFKPSRDDPYFTQREYQIFNPEVFMKNLDIVAGHFNKQKAALIVRLLRDDWPFIKSLKLFGYDEKDDLLHDFEAFLFEGINCYLSDWEKQEQQTPPPPKTTICRYINPEQIIATRAYTVEEYIQKLKDSCKHADILVKTLYEGKKLGYLSFHGESVRSIYFHLKECFPDDIKFGYPNFSQYFKR